MEFDGFDGHPTTRHYLVLAQEGAHRPTVIGAGRLVLPDPALTDAADRLGFASRYGLPIEEKLDLDLSSVAPPGAFCEIGRICIERRWQGSTALAELGGTMCRDSLALGFSHWISTGNIECDSLTEARLVRRLIEQQGLLRGDARATLRHEQAAREIGHFRLFSEEDRQRILSGGDRPRLPRAVAAEARLGARYFGEPLWEPRFGTYAMPLIASLRDVLNSTQRLRLERPRQQAA